MDMTNFKQYILEDLRNMNVTKGELAKLAIPEDVTFDTALPQRWLDEFTDYVWRNSLLFNPEEDRRFIYQLTLGTSFVIYSRERGFPYGLPWSACVEISDLIEKFMYRD